MSTTRVLLVAPVTQTIAAVVSLLKYIGKPTNPPPEAVWLPEAALVLSNKKDVYYTTTAKSCSCPAATYRPNQQCKHQRRYYPENSIKRQSMVEVLNEHDKNLSSMPGGYQRIVRAAREEAESEPLQLRPKGSFKPFLEE